MPNSRALSVRPIVSIQYRQAFDLLWICCRHCSTNPQRIEVMEFGSYDTILHDKYQLSQIATESFSTEVGDQCDKLAVDRRVGLRKDLSAFRGPIFKTS